MNERVTLITVGNGAALELFDHELAKVLANIADPNTAPRTKREIVIRVGFKTDENRERSDVTLEVTSKLAGVRPQTKEVYLGKQDGQHVAMQSNPRQGNIFDPPPPTAADMKDVERKIKDVNID